MQWWLGSNATGTRTWTLPACRPCHPGYSSTAGIIIERYDVSCVCLYTANLVRLHGSAACRPAQAFLGLVCCPLPPPSERVSVCCPLAPPSERVSDSTPAVHTHPQHNVHTQPGKPLFVSMLLYLNRSWAPELHAETLFVDPDSGTGVFVQPRAGRVVLMDQDVPHRIGAASPMAGDQPRFSLVWKLVFWPQQDYAQGLANSQLQEMSLARPQWGAPVHLGSPSSA